MKRSSTKLLPLTGAKIIALIAILLVVIGGIIFIFWYMNKGNDNAPAQAETVQEADTAAAVAEQPVQDTATSTQAPNVPGAVNADGTMTYKVALQQYAIKEKAESRVAKLQSYGNTTVEMYAKDSATYYVVMSVTSAADTTHIIDSLRKQFNPGGKVMIVH